MLRLIIMRIRFRASDFGLVAKISIIGAKSKQASCVEMVLGSFVFLLVWFSSYVFGLRKFKPTSTTDTSGAAPSALRSALDSSIQAYAQTLVWPSRDVLFSTKHPSLARELLFCVYSRMMRSHERRALGALLSLFSSSEPALIDSWLQSGYGEARRLRSRVVVVFIVQRIDR